MQYKISRVEGRKQVQRKKQVADFIIKTEWICEKEDRLNNLRSLTFAKDNIDKNVKECVLFKTYEERFERSLHLWKLPSVTSPREGIGESGPLHWSSEPHWDLRKTFEKSFFCYRGVGLGIPCMHIVTSYCSPANTRFWTSPRFWAGEWRPYWPTFSKCCSFTLSLCLSGDCYAEQ